MKNILFAIFVLAIISCRESQNKSLRQGVSHIPNPNALEFNNKAVDLIGETLPYNDSINNVLYDSALIYLDQAIATDSLYLTAYTNKAQVLIRKNLLVQALQILNQAQTIKADFAEVIMGQGFILEKLGQIDSANIKYRQALQAYEKRLDTNPKDIKIQADIAFLYLFLEDKNKAIDEIRNLILQHPDNASLKEIEKAINDFDRNKFIEEY